MFKNIGGKIKTIAEISCWLGIIASIFVGFLLIGNDLALAGFIIMAVGSLASWIGSFMTYGFGQLIQNTDKIRKAMNCPDDEDEMQLAYCPKCKMKTYIENGECHFCGYKFDNK